MPFNPDRSPVKQHSAARRVNPHSKKVLSGGSMAAKLAKGRTGALLDGVRHTHNAWNRATAPVQTMEGKLRRGMTGGNLEPQKKRKKRGRWSGFVYDLTKNRSARAAPLVRIPRPSDKELYGEDPRRARVRARISHLRNLRPY